MPEKKLIDTSIYLIILQNFLRETIIYNETIQNKYKVDPALQIVVGEGTKLEDPWGYIIIISRCIGEMDFKKCKTGSLETGKTVHLIFEISTNILCKA